LLPECLDDWVGESNPVRAVDAFVDALDLAEVGFNDVEPAATGRPGYHPSPLLKLYIYGYLNRIQSSRRLEREAGRNLEVIWLLRRLTPDDKTIADFRKDNGPAIKIVCARFVDLCRQMGLLTKASVAIDGSKFKAVNTRDKNFTKGKVERRPQAAGGERRALSRAARHGRSAGAIRSARCEDRASQREARQAWLRDAEAGSLREGDAGHARPADLAHRS
jgi:transposase